LFHGDKLCCLVLCQKQRTAIECMRGALRRLLGDNPVVAFCFGTGVIRRCCD